MMKYFVRLIGLGVIIVIGGLFFVRGVVYTSHGPVQEPVAVTIEDGATTKSIARNLAQNGLIAHEWAFVLYMRLHDDVGVLKAGTYTIAPFLTIPDIATILVDGKGVSRDISITFPEGWQIRQIAQRLIEKGFDGALFEEIARNPDAELRQKFEFLASLPEGMSLEGYLFPDTYSFLPEATARDIVEALLANFDKKFTPEMRAHITQFDQTIHDVVTLASIIEREVHIEKERPIVSGIFYNRLRDGMTLGSDATLDYIFGESKIKHTIEDTKVDSPYNTYQNPGLPPGPIGNPGVSSLRAATYPEKTEYYFFLNNATTGQTVFSRTYQEHLRNMDRNGL